jgi:hypothetical protein
MNVGGVIDSPSRRSRTITVVAIVVVAALSSVYFFTQYRAVRTVKVHGGRGLVAKPGWAQTIRGVAIYILVDASAHFNPDLRTRFWEPQLETLRLQATVDYVSDAPVSIGQSINWIVPPYCQREKADSDPGYCYRNVESWSHFVSYQSRKRWYFKGSQDTYIDVANLLMLIDRLEETIDPMTQAYFQYTIDETNGVLTPDGVTGWLLSNAAVQTLFHHAQHFIYGCDKLGEDSGMAQMIHNLQLEVDQFISPFFIAEWPNDTLDVLTTQEQTAQFYDCPEKQYRYTEKVEAPFDDPKDLVATRMPFAPMDQVEGLLTDFNKDLRIGYPADHQPVFCFGRD